MVANYPIVDLDRSFDEAQSVTGAWLTARQTAPVSILKNTFALLSRNVRAGVEYVKLYPVFTGTEVIR